MRNDYKIKLSSPYDLPGSFNHGIPLKVCIFRFLVKNDQKLSSSRIEYLIQRKGRKLIKRKHKNLHCKSLNKIKLPVMQMTLMSSLNYGITPITVDYLTIPYSNSYSNSSKEVNFNFTFTEKYIK